MVDLKLKRHLMGVVTVTLDRYNFRVRQWTEARQLQSVVHPYCGRESSYRDLKVKRP